MENTQLVTKKPAIKWPWLRVLLYLLAALILMGIGQAIAAVIVSAISGISPYDLGKTLGGADQSGIKLIIELSGLIFVLGITWIFRRYIDSKSFVSMGYSMKGRLKDCIYGILVGLVLISLGFFSLLFTDYLEITQIVFSFKIVAGSFFFYLVAAMIEEVIFRGYVLNNLMEYGNKYLALFLSSVLFALIHGMNPNLTIIAMVNLAIAGGVLGITYIYTKNIWYPVFLHVSWNYFQGPIYGFEVSGTQAASIISQKVSGNELITGGSFGFEGSIILTVLMIVLIIVSDLIMRKKYKLQD